MNPNLNFTVPDKFCPRCGDRIPVAGDSVNGRDGKRKTLRTSRLICEGCARDAPPVAKVFRRRNGEHHDEQATILTDDCPVIRL